jgi:hypothetical protein
MTIGGIYAIAVMNGPHPGKAALFGSVLAAVTVLFIVLALRAANSRLLLHERGIVYRRGGSTKVVWFAEISGVRERRFNDKPADLILQLRNGGEVTIEASIENYEHAAQTITENA